LAGTVSELSLFGNLHPERLVLGRGDVKCF
jgi:hypothetical protein